MKRLRRLIRALIALPQAVFFADEGEDFLAGSALRGTA